MIQSINKTSLLYTCPDSAANWYNKGCALCYHVYVILHVKDPHLFVIKIEHCILVTGFYLSAHTELGNEYESINQNNQGSGTILSAVTA